MEGCRSRDMLGSQYRVRASSQHGSEQGNGKPVDLMPLAVQQRSSAHHVLDNSLCTEQGLFQFNHATSI
eukprot:5972553-Amphidinium_carterae.1